MARQHVRLKDPDGGFHDSVTGFAVVRNQVKPLTEPIGTLTQKWLDDGGLVRCDPPKNAKSGPDDRGALPATETLTTTEGVTQDGSANTVEPGPAEGAVEEADSSPTPPPAPQTEAPAGTPVPTKEPATKPKRPRKPKR